MKSTKAKEIGAVDAVRHFNRFYTRKIGVLNEGLLESPFSLTEVRVLYELAQRSEATAGVIGRELKLDAGYLSRMLARFARRRLIERRRSSEDGRQMFLRLTGLGRKTFAELNERSSRQVGALIGHLPEHEQKRLAGMMQSVTQLLAMPEERSAAVTLRGPRAGEFGWVVRRHGELYAEEYGWDSSFEILVARVVADFGEKFNPRRERCWIAELEGQPVGCVFLVEKSEQVAQLRLLLVEPTARGHGAGRRLVEACVTFARDAGYHRVELWTNSVLHAARHIYEMAGFRMLRADKHHSFGHALVGETWALELK